MDETAHRMRNRRLLELLREYSFEKKDVVLSSGKKSDFYIDCRKTALTSEGHFLIGWLINDLLSRSYPQIEGVGGLTMGADPLVSAASTVSFLGGGELEAFYVRKEPKKHGTAQWVEASARLKAGSAQVAILEDVVTTGSSTIKAIDRSTEHGFKVACVVALVDRMEGGGRVIEEKVPFHPLYTRKDFISNAPGEG